MERPETRYAQSGDVHLAYQVVGSGEIDLVYVPGWISQLDLYWEEPSVARFLTGLASFSRLIVFDKRGIGLSDRVAPSAMPTLEERMDDVRAVLDAVGSERAAVFAQGFGTPIAILFAATHPERIASLILYEPSAKAGLKTDDYPWGSTPEEQARARAAGFGDWGSEEAAAEWVARLAPSAVGDRRFVQWVARVERASATPSTMRGFSEMNAQMDVREVLPLVRVPTLILGRKDAWLPKGSVDVPPLEEARYVAERIPGAKLVELEGRDYLPWIGDQESIVAAVAEFATGAAPAREAERVLLTVLFTDIVESTKQAAVLGDRRWHDLLDRHNAVVRRGLERFHGSHVDQAGDGVLATFDGPARGIRCAKALVEDLRAEGLEIRAGLHAGEVELLDGGIGGIAVHIGARVTAKAGRGEVLVTATVKELVAGSGIEFADRGLHALKGVPGRWRLFAAV